jgi:hypothetical protein
MSDKIDKLEKATISFLAIAFCAEIVALVSVLMIAMGF